MKSLLPLLVAIVISPVTAAVAQEVAGRVVDAGDGRPLSGALVMIADPSSNVTVARSITGSSGRFRVAIPRAGAWRIRLAAIGYSPSAVMVDVGDSLTTIASVGLAAQPYQLPDIVAAGRGSTCAVDDAGSPVLDRLIREAETALGLVQATIDSRRLEFVTEVWSHRVFTESRDTVRSAATARGRAAWPITSTDHATLRERGFVPEVPASGSIGGYDSDAGPVYYGPDANVLFSAWFLSSHCFALSGAPEGDTVRIQFEPRNRGAVVDVAGHLVIDRATMALTRLEYWYVGLPSWVPPDRAGGSVDFRRLPGGLWIVSAWRMRAPIRLERAPPRRRGVPAVGLGGWAEAGGAVVDIHER